MNTETGLLKVFFLEYTPVEKDTGVGGGLEGGEGGEDDKLRR